MAAPEAVARAKIDLMLGAAGWSVQDYRSYDPTVSRGVALREVRLKSGSCDYLLIVDRHPVGVVEAKKVGTTLSTVADQTDDYAVNLPEFFKLEASSLPFLYESTGEETFFRDARDPAPRSRPVFWFHRPETLAEWHAESDTLRRRLQRLPPLVTTGMRQCQVEAIQNLETSFAGDRPRALIQMATGSGKTYAAVSFIYRLVKFAGARRVLFLVDRNNLGVQTKGEFDQYVTPDTGRKFGEIYNVQHLTSSRLDPVCRVTISTIQRLYSMLRGEELPEDADELSGFQIAAADNRTRDVACNPNVPIETFDFIVTDECHRSIYNLWRQVLEYFDASLVGLTATPSKQTIGFFNQNLVMEYGHERAVADGVNVGYDVYRIRTDVTEKGGKVEAGFYVDKRSRETRAVRWERLDEDFAYANSDLDRSVVVPSQMRTVLAAFRDAALTELFPGRTMLPKTIIFAKDDSHAEDVVHICREVFGRGNDFCRKITYRSFNPETRRYEKSEHLIQQFRTSPTFRVAVSVDMIATGTDIRPVECLIFLRDVRSRVYFEQMKGRGTRTLTPTDLQAVSGADANAKDHFVIVDAVGVCESDKTDSRPLERERSVAFDKLVLGVALGKRNEDTLTTLAGRLARLDRDIGPAARKKIEEAAGGKTIAHLVNGLLDAVDPDKIAAHASPDDKPREIPAEKLEESRKALVSTACGPFESPAFREAVTSAKRELEQTIDTVTIDSVIDSAFDSTAKEKAKAIVTSFRDFIDEHRAEIEALQILYSRPYRHRLTEEALKDLETKLKDAPDHFTKEALWKAYNQAEPGKVRGQVGRFTDLVSIVRFALEQEPVLEPFEDHVRERFQTWMGKKAKSGITFTGEEMGWLEKMRDAIAASGSVDKERLELAGELGQVYRVFGEKLWPLIDELNVELVA